jgi:hypothetical protein
VNTPPSLLKPTNSADPDHLLLPDLTDQRLLFVEKNRRRKSCRFPAAWLPNKAGQAAARAVDQRVQVAEHTLRRHRVPPYMQDDLAFPSTGPSSDV